MSANDNNKSLDQYFGIPLYVKCKGLFAEPFVADYLPTDGKPASSGNKLVDDYWHSDELEYEKF
ncbi:MAG: hypothetical protein IPL83_08225 [Bdellovibrionales bacterium]|nr:hypothetical protein [Bdellovibrionales bacterium]